ncbi:MAG: P-loop NTPase, partial [Candidatus Diapherotrites archaeon]
LMSGINDRVLVNEFGRFIPLTTSFGLKVISVGNMVESNSIANIMRGPIMFKLIFDMLSKTEWQNLDFLIIDLPPGTNDNPLTIMQLVNLDGLIIVTQPQKAALFDAEKSFDMAKKMNVRVLGVVENMSSEIFGQGTAREIASKYRIPFLGTILLDKRIRETSDKGLPAVLEYQDLLENFEVIIKNLNENLLKFRKQ